MGGRVTDEKGDPGKGGSGPPDPPPPSGHAYAVHEMVRLRLAHTILKQNHKLMFGNASLG